MTTKAVLLDHTWDHRKGSAPGTPASGFVRGPYARTSSSGLWVKDDTGTEYDLTRNLPRVVAMTDGATITPNADTTDLGTVTLGGNRAMAAPSGTPVAGQQLMFRFKQDGTGGRTLTWDSIYRFGSDVPQPTLTTTANKSDYVGFQYNATDSKWDCLAVARNY